MNHRDIWDLFLMSALWGSSFLLIKWSGEVFPPFWVAFLRCVFGACVLWMALKMSGQGLPPRHTWKALFWVALLNNVVPWTLFPIGEQTVSSNITAILNATTPLFSLFIGLSLRDAQVTPYVIGGVFIGLMGVVMTVLGGVQSGTATMLGVGVILLATLCYAVATTIAKKNLAGVNSVSLATSQLSLAVLTLLPFVIFGPQPNMEADASLPKALGAVFLLGILGSGVAYILFYRLLARTSSTHVTAVTYFLPIWGLFWGLLDGEHITTWSIVGVVIILAGVMLMNKKKMAQEPAQ